MHIKIFIYLGYLLLAVQFWVFWMIKLQYLYWLFHLFLLFSLPFVYFNLYLNVILLVSVISFHYNVPECYYP